jgi:hypothetical protein
MRPHATILLSLLALGCPPAEDTASQDSETQPETVTIEDLGWRSHEEIESLIYVSFEQLRAGSAWVEFKPVEDEEWMSTPAVELGVGPAEFLLLGLPYGLDFEYRVANDFGDGPLYSELDAGTVPAAPEQLPLAQLHSADAGAYEPSGKFLLTSVNANTGGWVTGDYWKVIIDRKGRTVWALETPSHHWTTFMRVSLNGEDLLYDQFTFWANWDSGAGSQVHRMKIDGTHLASYATPGGHHAFTELRDGSLVWTAASWSTETLEKLDPEGTQSTIWDCDAFHRERGINAMCQSNTVTWDEPTDTFLVSFYTTNTLVHIDHASGETLRVWGSNYGDYAFDPETSAFTWQHGAYWLDSDTILLSTHRTDVPDEELETVAREYDVDDEGLVLTNTWSFGEGEGLHAHTAGEALRLPNGNTLHNYGSYGRLREVTSDGSIVWDVDWRIELTDDYDRLIGRTTFIEDLYAFAP